MRRATVGGALVVLTLLFGCGGSDEDCAIECAEQCNGSPTHDCHEACVKACEDGT